MGIMDRFRRRETRSGSIRSDDPFLAGWFGLHGRGAGAANPEAVLSNLSVAARCVGLRAELMASLPVHVFRRKADGGRERATDTPLYRLLHEQPNPRTSGFEFFEAMVRSLDLFGNFVCEIERGRAGEIEALWPVPWADVTVEELDSRRLRYRIANRRGGMKVLLQEEVLHVRGPSRDGIIGLSPLQISRGSLGLALAQNESAAGMTENGLQPSGIISFEQKLSTEQRENFRTYIASFFAGSKNAGKVMILDNAASYSAASWTPEDAQFLESRKLSNEDVARAFGLPPTAVGILDHGTYSNVAEESAALVRNAIGPLCARIEQALSRCLIPPDQRSTLYVEFDLGALLRGDVKSRFEAYRLAREAGIFSANDCRRRENETPVPGGDDYHMPANWVPLGTTAAANKE